VTRAEALCAWLRDYSDHRLNSPLMDARRCMPPHVVMDLGNRGVLGLLASEAYGGRGFTQPEALAVFEQLGAIDLTLAIFVGIHNGLGIRPIEHFGGAALKSDLLPQLASGRILGAFAMTEPAAGSNARDIEATAITDAPGSWRLRGSKLWVGNGSWAGVINIVTRRPPEEDGGMSAFAVRAGTPGLRMGAEAMTTGMRAIVQNALHLDDVAVTAADLLGKPGDGFGVANDMFRVARLGIAAIALGGLRRCTQLAYRFASRRQINTGLLLDNARTREVLASMVASVAASECLLRYVGDRCEDDGAPAPHLAAICKAIVPELLWQATDQAMQLLGGRGYIESNAIPQMMRDARLLRIFEGPTEVLEMHLGSALLSGTFTLFDEGSRARSRFETWLRELEATIEGTTGDARITRSQQVKLAIGNLAGWALMAAAAEHQDHALAMRWALAQLESRAEAATRAIRTPLVEAAALAETIATYRAVIGDLEQHLPGEDHALDPMLRR
jgi:alkylation response protein AidB-like acyl-CoA dehydrogenase